MMDFRLFGGVESGDAVVDVLYPFQILFVACCVCERRLDVWIVSVAELVEIVLWDGCAIIFAVLLMYLSEWFVLYYCLDAVNLSFVAVVIIIV